MELGLALSILSRSRFHKATTQRLPDALLPPRNCRMLCQEWGDSKVVQRRPVDCLMTQIPPGQRCSTQDAAKLNCCNRNPQRMNNALSRTNARQQTPCTRGEANQDTICQNTNKAMKQSNSTKYKASPKHYRPAN